MENSKVSISVVIPTHDRPELLKNAIDSVLNQTVLPDEIIVVDDTSSSATKELVDSYNNEILRWVQNKNNGACSSRNLGAKVAISDYVAFLDDDDLWLKEKLEEQKKLLPKNDAVFSRLYINYEGTNIRYETRGSMPANPLNEICMENFIGGTITSVIRRGLFIELGGFDERFPAREEYDLWIRIISSNASIDIVTKPLVVANRSLNKRSRISANISNYEYAIELLNDKHSKLVNEVLSKRERVLRKSKQYQFLAAQAVSISLRKESSLYYFKSFLAAKSIKPLILSMLSVISPVLVIRLRSFL